MLKNSFFKIGFSEKKLVENLKRLRTPVLTRFKKLELFANFTPKARTESTKRHRLYFNECIHGRSKNLLARIMSFRVCRQPNLNFFSENLMTEIPDRSLSKITPPGPPYWELSTFRALERTFNKNPWHWNSTFFFYKKGPV